jgi:serine/threonine protein phosphatase PrpC
MVPDEQLGTIISGGKDHEAIVQTLINAANQSGGRDNITVIIVAVKELRLP